MKFLKRLLFVLPTILGMILLPSTAVAQLGGGVGATNYWKLNGTALNPINQSWTLGSSANRLAKVWTTDLDASTLLITSLSANGCLTAGGTATSTLCGTGNSHVGGTLTTSSTIEMTNGVSFGSSAAKYVLGRDSDATNQMHFNVPTGARFEWSVNDTAVGTLSSTEAALSTPLTIGNSLGFSAATSPTAAAIQVFRDQTATPNFLGFNVPANSGYSYYVNGVIEAYQSATGFFQTAGNNYKLFNTSDIVTNTEALYMDWATNIARIYTFPTGSGTARNLQMSALNSSAGGGTVTLSSSPSFITLSHSATGLSGSLASVLGSSTASSGTVSDFVFAPTLNQSGTASHNSVTINPTETTVGSGTRNLLLLQVGSTDRFAFRNDGDYIQTPKVRTTGLPVGFTFTGAAHTGVTNSIFRDIYFNFNQSSRTVAFAGGGAPIQYSSGLELSPIAFSAASAQSIGVISTQMTVGAAIAGSNITATTQAAQYSVFGTGKSANLITYGSQMPGIDTSVGSVTLLAGYAVQAGPTNGSLGNQTSTLTSLASFYNDAITYDSTTNVRTVTDAAGAIFNAPVAGTNVTFTNKYGVLVKTGDFGVEAGRVLQAKGKDVASANDITLGNGNYFDITGTTSVQRMLGTGWKAGSVVILQFDASLTVVHNTAAGSGYYGFQLVGSGDFSATSGDTLTVVFDGANWREVARSVI